MNVFVFGSNEAGRHGKGSAQEALQNHGAIYGQGYGLQGNSYGIPTKNMYLSVLPLGEIQEYVRDFLSFAARHSEMTFDVVKIGCGLSGYDEIDIIPMFKGFTTNVNLPDGWGV